MAAVEELEIAAAEAAVEALEDGEVFDEMASHNAATRVSLSQRGLSALSPLSLSLSLCFSLSISLSLSATLVLTTSRRSSRGVRRPNAGDATRAQPKA